MNIVFALFCAAALSAPLPASAHNAPAPGDWKDIGLEDRTGSRVPRDIKFTDEHGVPLSLGGYADRPTLVLPAYYSCRQVCATMLENLAVAMNGLKLRPGRDYRAVALGIDETEGPALALESKELYRRLLGKEFAENDWKFLTGDAASIRRFADAAGYRFKRTGKHEFSHPTVLIVLAPDGTIIRYIYGPEFLPFDLGMALTEAARGTPSLTVRKVLSYCFAYDAEKKTYTFRAAQAVALGLFSMMAVGMYFLLRKKAGLTEELKQ